MIKSASVALGGVALSGISGMGQASAMTDTSRGPLGHAPVISGPIKGGKRGYPFSAYLDDLGALGYVEEEYFIEGEATRFNASGALGEDGKWSVEPAGTAPYRTRLLVRRPIDPTRFNGTVVLEWINVTAGYENATIGGVSPDIYASGYAFVTASVQRVGIDGFANDSQGLKVWDPERYGSLNIPGDAYSYDIFSQAGRALGPLAHRQGRDPLAGLKVQRIIATGASQSAIRLRGYCNGIQPLHGVFDGIVTTLDFGTAADFEEWVYDPTVLAPGDTGRLFPIHTRIRADLKTPVIVVGTEFETLRMLPVRQDDSPTFRFWEIASASHVPAGDARRQDRLKRRDGVSNTPFDGGSEVLWQPTADAAIDRMNEWIRGTSTPSMQPWIAVGDGPAVVRDEFGNARGGIRLPEVEVPIATYNGVGSGTGLLAGTTTPFSKERLRSLYPSEPDYKNKVRIAAEKALEAGVISAGRARQYVDEARADWLRD